MNNKAISMVRAIIFHLWPLNKCQESDDIQSNIHTFWADEIHIAAMENKRANIENDSNKNVQ